MRMIPGPGHCLKPCLLRQSLSLLSYGIDRVARVCDVALTSDLARRFVCDRFVFARGVRVAFSTARVVLTILRYF